MNWSTYILNSETKREFLYRSMFDCGIAEINKCAVLLAEFYLWEFFKSDKKISNLILDSDGIARTKIYQQFNKCTDPDWLILVREMSEKQWSDYASYLKKDGQETYAKKGKDARAGDDPLKKVVENGKAIDYWILTKARFDKHSGGGKQAKKIWLNGLRKGAGVEGS